MDTKFLLLLLFITPTIVLGKKYFTAAVFEHRPRDNGAEGPQEILNNLKYYEKAAEVAAEKGVDIILFNEYGLFGWLKDKDVLRKDFMEHVPDPEKKKVNPCDEKVDGSVILPFFSCIAKKYKMYVVGNLGDKQPCDGTCDSTEIGTCKDKCHEDGYKIYNTDVAFDRKGNLIARYHKVHPYFENVNVPEEPEYKTFETEFGKFGLIVCFDSVWGESMRLAKYYNIDTLLFPTFWFDDIVPLNGVEWQQSWAIANDVNFIAANTHTPGSGSLGSGIYSREKGALVYTYEPDGESKLLVANVPIGKSSGVEINPSISIIKLDSIQPKIETGDAFPDQGYEKMAGPAKDMHIDYRYFTSQTENYTLVKLESEKGELKACNNGFCCELSYTANDMKEDYYIGSFSGLNNAEGFYHWCEEVCLLVRCDPLEGKACVMQPHRSNTVFTSLKIKAKFNSDRVYPTVSKTKHRLAPRCEWRYEKKGQDVTLSFKSKSNEPLLKAALLGRCYDRDPEFTPWYKD